MREIPFRLVEDLPVRPLKDGFDVIAVTDNYETVRISWDGLVDSKINATDVPTSTGASGSYADIAVDGTGVFTYSRTSWGKTPRYLSNWEDLTGDTRFLLVNAPMELSEDELSNARASLDIHIATASAPGLVKGSSSAVVAADGTLTIPEAVYGRVSTGGQKGLVYVNNTYGSYTKSEGEPDYVITENYLAGALEDLSTTISSGIPVASKTARGIVQVGDGINVSNGVISVSYGNANTPGLVRISNSYNAQAAQQAASTYYVYSALAVLKEDILDTKATASALGLVRVPTDSTITLDSSGNITVPQATDVVPGLVTLQEDISESAAVTENPVPTPEAVRNYVDDQLDERLKDVEPATAETLGTVKIGQGINVDEGTISIANATQNSLGAVTVTPASISDTAPYNVYSKTAVDAKLANIEAQAPVATYSKQGLVKLGSATPALTTDIPILSDGSGRLRVSTATVKSVADATPEASISEAGKVKLSTSESPSGSGWLQIGKSSDGAIHAKFDTELLSGATTTTYGVVKLGTGTIIDSSSSGVTPVGVDVDGKMYVATAGGGFPYTVEEITEGTQVASVGSVTDEESGEKQLAVPEAASDGSGYGVVKLSGGTVSTHIQKVGIDADGDLAVSVIDPGIVTKATATGTENARGHSFVLDPMHIQAGALSSISIMCRTNDPGSHLQLGIFEKQENGQAEPSTWKYLGSSEQVVSQVVSQVSTWTFKNVYLSGRAIAVRVRYVPDTGNPDPISISAYGSYSYNSSIGLRASNRPAGDTTSRVIGDNVSLNIVPQLELAIAGGTGGGSVDVQPATYNTAGIVKLGTSSTAPSDGIAVGVDYSGHLRLPYDAYELYVPSEYSMVSPCVICTYGTSLAPSFASHESAGVVVLGTGTQLDVATSVAVGVDANGKLRADISPGEGGFPYKVHNAVQSGLEVGYQQNSASDLVLAIPQASPDVDGLGAVKLSSGSVDSAKALAIGPVGGNMDNGIAAELPFNMPATIAEGEATVPVGIDSDLNLVAKVAPAAPATATTYGTVKVAGTSGDDNNLLVGTNSQGQLAVSSPALSGTGPSWYCSGTRDANEQVATKSSGNYSIAYDPVHPIIKVDLGSTNPSLEVNVGAQYLCMPSTYSINNIAPIEITSSTSTDVLAKLPAEADLFSCVKFGMLCVWGTSASARTINLKVNAYNTVYLSAYSAYGRGAAFGTGSTVMTIPVIENSTTSASMLISVVLYSYYYYSSGVGRGEIRNTGYYKRTSIPHTIGFNAATAGGMGAWL